MSGITYGHLSKERELAVEKWLKNEMSKEELKAFYLETFLSMRDDWSNELPDIRVSALAKLEDDKFFGDNYKCRASYIVALSLYISGAIERNVIIDSNIVKKYESLKNYNFKFINGEFTTREEIDMLNDMLNDVIEHLRIMEKEYLMDLLSELIVVKKISFIDNYICILFKRTLRGRWIKVFVKEIKITFLKTSRYIFINLDSKNLLLERIFRKLNKKMSDKIQFSVKQQDRTKFGYRYVIIITRSGVDYIKEKYPKIADFFQISSCNKITWNIEDPKIKFNIK